MTNSNDPITSGDLANKFNELRADVPTPPPSTPTAQEIQDKRPIDKGDFINKFSELKGGVDVKAGEAKNQAITIAAVGGVVITLIGFLLGLKRGKGKSTVVEIRRV